MNDALRSSTRMLSEHEAAALLAEHGIRYVDHEVAVDAAGAVAAAGRIGYPVVLKVISPDIVHKTEVGGVVTGLSDASAVREGCAMLNDTVRGRMPDARIEGVLVARHADADRELIVGATRDATFGPVVMAGFGGVAAEVLDDVAFRLAPLHRDDALDLLTELRGFKLLTGHRGGRPVDLEAVADVIVQVGAVMEARPDITAIDLNPVAVSADDCVALDARIILEGEAQ
jgi:succinyl-CoA synthetase beta subunit